jgi:hypothetical protein
MAFYFPALFSSVRAVSLLDFKCIVTSPSQQGKLWNLIGSNGKICRYSLDTLPSSPLQSGSFSTYWLSCLRFNIRAQRSYFRTIFCFYTPGNIHQGSLF